MRDAGAPGPLTPAWAPAGRPVAQASGFQAKISRVGH